MPLKSQSKEEARNRAFSKKLTETTCKVDDIAPRLNPEIYLKSKHLVRRSVAMHNQIQTNLALVSTINRINRTAGKVSCWEYPKDTKRFQNLRRTRVLEARRIVSENKEISNNLNAAKTTIPPKAMRVPPPQPPVKIKGSFASSIETAASSSSRSVSAKTKYWMEIATEGDIIMGKLEFELFEKKCPNTCHLFKQLVEGRPDGRAYTGTRVYMVVPDLFCSLGDVVDDDGFGHLILEEKLSLPENFLLNHYTSGVLSMPLFKGYINGTFNITFKAMPLLDGQAVVFGRVVGGKSLLAKIREMGTPFGLVTGRLVVSQCGWITKNNEIHCGARNTTLRKDDKKRSSM